MNIYCEECKHLHDVTMDYCKCGKPNDYQFSIFGINLGKPRIPKTDHCKRMIEGNKDYFGQGSGGITESEADERVKRLVHRSKRKTYRTPWV